LIATVPIGAPCHSSSSYNGSLLSTYSEAACNALRNVWYLPETHLSSSSSPMAYPFSNNSCNPWLLPNTTCTLGGHVAYSVNATGVDDLQKTVSFAKLNNIRLVIRNTGHDYLGKSTGAHALAIWTHYMKDIELIEAYDSAAYAGPAIKVGAGVESIEAFTFASSHKLMVVGGNCPTVGIAGGYTQGGGHGQLASKYGLSADQVLEWEVITTSGDLVTANANSHPDLFWALRGGGGGTYGVVVSMTIKAFPDTFFSTAYATVLNNGTNTDALYEAVGTFLQSLPSLVDAGAFVVWVADPFGFMLSPAIAPDLHQEDLDRLTRPFITKLTELGLDYQYTSYEKSTFLSNYKSQTGSWNVSDTNLGGRLIPRSLLEESPQDLLKAVRSISSQATLVGVTFNVSRGVSSPDENAVNPYFRDALVSVAIGTAINYTDWSATVAGQNQITNVFLPKIASLTPNGGVYLNEADFQASDFKTLFYGTHYERLEKIKARYDPDDILYAKTAVGSDRWAENEQGRLCRTS
jgi:FAD/FMN-containing dehydrogenase